jgi:excisionase family DNA binding protein
VHRRLQFGMRENPASDRRHGSRQAVRPVSETSLVEETLPISLPLPRGPNHPVADAEINLNAALPHAATGKVASDANDSHAVETAAAHSRKPALNFEPLIGSSEAAKLLGNIHVKTLQRYARRQRIPGYQIGGHWYFRASELDAWLRSQINSSCHPCRLPKEAK